MSGFINAERFLTEHRGADIFEVITMAYEEGRKDGKSEQLEIIKCMECRHYEASIVGNPWGVCCHEDWIANNIGHNVDENGWCYRAERRTTE